jgi:predicted  nucleic acid-binding Zn-ribbon protein
MKEMENVNKKALESEKMLNDRNKQNDTLNTELQGLKDRINCLENDIDYKQQQLMDTNQMMMEGAVHTRNGSAFTGEITDLTSRVQQLEREKQHLRDK